MLSKIHYSGKILITSRLQSVTCKPMERQITGFKIRARTNRLLQPTVTDQDRD